MATSSSQNGIQLLLSAEQEAQHIVNTARTALVERLAPHVERELNLVINAKEEAESLSSKLNKLQIGLQEAEREGVTNDAVKQWLKQLETVAHEMEDVLDEWEIRNLQIELEGVSDDPSNFLANAHSLIITLCLCFKPVLGRRSISKKVKALSDRMDKILSDRGRYNFGSGENINRGQEFRQEPSTSIVPSNSVYGRNDVRDSLVEKLMSGGEEVDVMVKIVSIVGIGGIGKTTLAQLAYNDVQVQGFFYLKGWVSVSEPFDADAVARDILEQFGQSSADARTLETLVQRIKTCVQDKRFLLVLDNVWTKDSQKWERLKNCLDGGAKGSRILVTTRSKSVARMMGTALWQPLNLLSDLECSEILNGIALGGGGRRRNENQLRCIGVEIAKKCNGLPLAAKSLGSMLALKTSEEEWRAVLESPLWTHEEGEVRDVFRHLNLSYTELSPEQKRCFLSSAIFPKGALMSIDEMIRIWMAHGYLNSKSADFYHVRSKGLRYFHILEMRSFFVKVESDKDDGDVESFKMHDIMHEFATYILVNEGYSFIAHGGAPCDLPPASLGKLRTFCERHIYEENKLVLVKSVRVLSLCNCRLESLPAGVGELVHLRYLDVSRNPIKELPKAVTNLYNLQTLGIVDCRYLTSLPEGIEKLGRLRHILNSGTNSLYRYPQGLEKLSGLWTLSEFKAGESNLGYLGNLNQLQGSLTLELWGFNDVDQARMSNLGNKNHIKELELIFDSEERLDDAVLEALRPPPNLQILHISNGGGEWLSHWIQRSFDKLKLLTFSGVYMCSDLPPFGKLPALEKLVVYGCAFKCLKTEFLAGGFPRLKTLCFTSCRKWEEWEDIKEEDGAASGLRLMRCLEELEVDDCGGLKALPHSLLRQAKSLKTIKLLGTSGSHLHGGEMTHLPNVKWVVSDTSAGSQHKIILKTLYNIIAHKSNLLQRFTISQQQEFQFQTELLLDAIIIPNILSLSSLMFPRIV